MEKSNGMCRINEGGYNIPSINCRDKKMFFSRRRPPPYGRAATGCLPKENYLTAASVNVSCHTVETIRFSVTDVVAWDGERVT